MFSKIRLYYDTTVELNHNEWFSSISSTFSKCLRFSYHIPFWDTSLKSVGDNFLPLLVRRGIQVSLFWSWGVFFYPVYGRQEPCFFLVTLPSISTEGDSKPEMILIIFLYRNTPSTTMVFSTLFEVSLPTSILVKLQRINLITKDKDKYLSGCKRCLENLHLLIFVIVNVFNHVRCYQNWLKYFPL